MGRLPDKIRVWVVARDMALRARLREALCSVLFKPVIRGFASAKEMVAPATPAEAPEVVLVALSYGRETIAQIISLFRTGPETKSSRVVVAIDGRGNLDGPLVVGLYLDGIDGFVSEPYSIRDLQLLFDTLFNAHEPRDAQVRARKSAVFVVHDAMQYIDQIAAKLALAERAPAQARKELQNVSKTLLQLYTQNPGEVEKALIDAFEGVPAPKVSDIQHARRAVAQRVLHPGKIVRDLIAERRFTVETLAKAMRLEKEDLQTLVDEKGPVTEALANALSRGLGRSPRDWLKLQRDFDKQQEKVQKGK